MTGVLKRVNSLEVELKGFGMAESPTIRPPGFALFR